jgi:hypothetical protein
MLIELRVIGEDDAAIAADIALLAKEFGAVAGDITFTRDGLTITGSASAGLDRGGSRGDMVAILPFQCLTLLA